MKPGVYYDLSFAEYQKIEAVNNSLLKCMARSPQHARRHILGEADKKSTPATQFGRALHALVLEPDKFNSEWIKGPDCRRGTIQWATFEHAAKGKEILKPDEWVELFAIAESVTGDRWAAPLLRSVRPEVTLVWKDPKTDLLCKARLDALGERHIADLKTTTDASPAGFEDQLQGWGYRKQAAFYLEGCKRLSLPVENFYFIAVEKTPHYPVAVYAVDEYVLELSHKENQALLAKLADCKHRNVWPGYTEGVKTIGIPRYAMNKLEETYGESFSQS